MYSDIHRAFLLAYVFHVEHLCLEKGTNVSRGTLVQTNTLIGYTTRIDSHSHVKIRVCKAKICYNNHLKTPSEEDKNNEL